MRTLMRISAAFITAVSSYYFIYWFGSAALLSLHLPRWALFTVPLVVGLAIAILAARYVWTRTELPHTSFATSVLLGALLTGSVAFSAGFFGPVILTPHANQGPMLGLFITGPVGFVLGAVGGAIRWLIRRHAHGAA